MADTFSPDQALDAIGFGPLQWGVFVGTGLVWAADACSVMLMSFLGPAARCQWSLSPLQESLLSSVVFLGMLVGALVWGGLGDVLGRRYAVLASCAFTAVCGVWSALATNYLMLLVARAAAGFGLAAAPTAFTLFLEWVPTRQRGRWMVLFNVWWTVGTVAEAVLAWAVLHTWGWRTLVAVSAVPQVLVVCLFPYIPESPHLLMAQSAMQHRALSGDPPDGAKYMGLGQGGEEHVCAAMRLMQHAARLAGKQLPPGVMVPDASDAVSPDTTDDEVEEEPGTDEGTVNSAEALAGFVASTQGTGRECVRVRGSQAVDVEGGGGSLGGVHGSVNPSLNSDRHLAPGSSPAGVEHEPLLPGCRGGSRAPSIDGCASPGDHGLAVGTQYSRHRHPLLRPAMLVLVFIWFVAAMAYYGSVILAAELRIPHNSSPAFAASPPPLLLDTRTSDRLGSPSLAGVRLLDDGAASDSPGSPPLPPSQPPTGDGVCNGPGGSLSLPDATFTGVVLAATAELPSYAFCVLVVGSGPPQSARALTATLAGAATALLGDAALRSSLDLQGGEGIAGSGLADAADAVILLAARFLVCAAFTLLYLYTPELLPTRVRAFGMGLCNSVSRLGGLAAPLLAVGVVEQGRELVPLCAFGGACALAAAAMLLAPPHVLLPRPARTRTHPTA